MKTKSTLLFLSTLMLVLMIGVPTAQAQLRDLNEGVQDEVNRTLPTAGSGNPEGTFALTVTAPGLPPFQELLTFHKGGTVSETNTGVHANSANPLLPFNGSDGYGAWHKTDDGTVAFKFVKLVFEGETNEHAGYLVVEATALIEGDNFANLESDVNILIGPDFFNPFFVIPFGPTDAVGKRITVDFDDDDEDDD